MKKTSLYLSLYQASVNESSDAPINRVTDFDRPLSVCIHKNSNCRISHVSLEFGGLKSRFLCSLTFDGSASEDISIAGFAMPKVKLNQRQKALCLLACMDFLISNGLIAANFDVLKERIALEQGQGSVSALYVYDKILARSISHAEGVEPSALDTFVSSQPVSIQF